jgi:hypothetical protein
MLFLEFSQDLGKLLYCNWLSTESIHGESGKRVDTDPKYDKAFFRIFSIVETRDTRV